MWGFKKKEKKEHSSTDNTNLDGFEIYTMKDDIERTKTKENERNKVKEYKSTSTSSPFLADNKDFKNEEKLLASFTTRKKPEPKVNTRNNTTLDLESEFNLNSQKEENISEQSFFGDIEPKNDNFKKSEEIVNAHTSNTNDFTEKSEFNVENASEKKEFDNDFKNNNFLNQNEIGKATYDVKKEYEESLKKDNESPNFSDSSDPFFSYTQKTKQDKYFGEKIDFSEKKKISFIKIIAILFVIALFVGVGVVGWFWYSGNSNIINNLLKNNGINIEIPNRTVVKENEANNKKDVNDKQDKKNTYSSKSLNQIKIQSTSTAVSDFSKKLKEIDQTLKKENNSNLIAFNVVDKDNKKLSFRSFCSMVNITLPDSVISNIEDNFTIYAYRSPVTLVTRFSIVADSLNSVMLKKALNNHEVNLVNSLRPLFIEKIPTRSDIVFDDSEYESYKIRFFNFKDGTNKSVDYSVINDKLFISTSMETMHFLIDALLLQK